MKFYLGQAVKFKKFHPFKQYVNGIVTDTEGDSRYKIFVLFASGDYESFTEKGNYYSNSDKVLLFPLIDTRYNKLKDKKCLK